MLLDAGWEAAEGPTSRVVGSYLWSGLGTTATLEWLGVRQAPGNEIVCPLACRVRTEDRTVTEAVDIRKRVAVEIDYEEPGRGPPL